MNTRMRRGAAAVLEIVMGTLAFWLLLGYARPWPIVLVPVVIGVFSTLVTRGRTEALLPVALMGTAPPEAVAATAGDGSNRWITPDSKSSA